MASRWSTALAVLVVLTAAGATFFRGLDWGLPSHAADRWLFGDRPVWSGAEIVQKLAARNDDSLSPVVGGEGRGDGARGADVDADPIVNRSQPVVLNDTDAKRAAIVQRYRLMSGQPDEFIQFKALAEMSQRQGLSRFDPRLYQYGGLWVYPVGAIVRGAIATGYIEAPPAGVKAREFYLDRPEEFGKFYILARAYSAAWGVIAAFAVFLISRDATRPWSSNVSDPAHTGNVKTGDAWRPGYLDEFFAVLAAIAFVFLPVVQTAAHEAKPHLAGTALCLLAVVAASKFVATGKRRWLIAASVACGAAMGMVVSMALSLAILPAMVFLRAQRSKNPLPRSWGRGQGEGTVADGSQNSFEPQASSSSPQHSPQTTGAREWSFVVSFVAAIVIALAVYVATNPFVLVNAIHAPQLLRSNLGNSTAMYGVHSSFAIVADIIRIAGHAMTPIGARIALACVIAVVIARCWRGRSAFALLLVPAALVALQFVLLAAGKQAEYARFGLVAFAAGCVAGAIALSALVQSPKRFGLCLIATLALCLLIPPIGGGNVFDTWKWDDGDQTALQLDTMRQLGNAQLSSTWKIGVAYEPAPWSAPPVNLFEEDIVLVRMTPAMLERIDAVVWPVNLETQLFEPSRDRESLDWRDPRWGVRSESRDGENDRWRGGW